MLALPIVLAEKLDAYRTMQEICLENGFQSESYTLQTSDGYNLGLWRIPGTFSDLEKTSAVPKPAILMIHN